MKIGIIGGGPAGIFAALEASKIHNVTILDANQYLGRKLASTGGGRGNLTNLAVCASSYHSTSNQETKQLETLLSQFDSIFLLDYFQQIGIPTYQTDDGWVYPISNSAKNLSIYLTRLLESKNIRIKNNVFVEKIFIEGNRCRLQIKNNAAESFDHLIVSTGGKAYPQIGASASILGAIQKLGYKTIPIYPALAPLKTTKKMTNLLKGTRFDAKIMLGTKNEHFGTSYGNIIFTDWGINGPGIMDLSHYINTSQTKETISVVINPLAGFTEQINDLIHNPSLGDIAMQDALLSIVPLKLVEQYQKNKSAYLSCPLSFFKDSDASNFLTGFNLYEEAIDTRDYKFSQISTGGISLDQIDLQTMKSIVHSNLSFAGEILDIYGPCGGFNLHWAFISGIIAGKNI